MEVEIHRAFLTVEGRKVRLTKDIARQLPLRHGATSERFYGIAAGKPVPQGICKILARVYDRDLRGWLILVPDVLSGLAWTEPVVMPKVPQETDADKAWDDLRQIPTVVL